MPKDRGFVQFYLKKRPDQEGKKLIYLQFKFYGKKLVFTFKQAVHPAEWSETKQRSKKDHSLNALLDKLASITEAAFKEELENGIPEPADIKKRLRDFMRRGQTGKVTFWEVLDDFTAGKIEKKKEDRRGSLKMSESTLDNYNALKLHLQDFGKSFGDIGFQNINKDFASQFRKHLEDKGLKASTIAKDFRLLKAVINYAVDNKLARERLVYSYTGGEAPDAVYLTEEEILHLYNHPCSNKSLERVRDRFIVSCQTGLAFTDLSELKEGNVFEEDGEKLIRIRRRKTGVEAVIPLEPETLEILEKYRWELPPISNQKFNDYIKEVCREAGFTATGRNADAPDLQLWECLSSHTGRRTFCTNAVLSGFPPDEIMKISGHTTSKAFFTYIRHNKTMTALNFIKHKKQKKSA